MPKIAYAVAMLTAIGVCSAAVSAGPIQAHRAAAISIEPVSAQREANITALEAGMVCDRVLVRGEEHRYQLALQAGEFVSVVVEQQGIDVVVQVSGPDDDVIANFQEEIRSRGEEHVDVVADKAGIYSLSIKPSAGIIVPGSYRLRMGSSRLATDVDRSLQHSRTLRVAAARLQEKGRFGEARGLLEEALQIAEAARGPDDADVIAVVFDLAGNALELRDNARSESLYQRAITVLDRTVGPEHPVPAMARSRLALLYERAGQYPKAQALLQPALVAIEKTLGPEHEWFVRCLVTLANLRYDAGDFEKAEEINRRGLAIVEKIQDTDSLLYAMLLNNLGDIQRQKGQLPEAEDLLRRSLAIGERLAGPDSYFVGTALQNLGIIARERKDYATAEALDERALSIREQIVGPDHPDVAQLLNNLAILYRTSGDDTRALETHFRALRIWEQAVGPYHRGTLVSAGNIARTYAATGDIANAIAFQRRTDTILEKQLALNLAVGSEREKLAFVKSASERTDRTISLHLDQAPGNPDAAALAVLVLLQRKGRVLDAMTDTFASAKQRLADAGDLGLIDQLNAAVAHLARFALDPPAAERPENRQKSIKDLETRKEQLEAELSSHSAELRADMRPVTLEAVQDAMPDDAALLEFVVFRPFDPKAERNAEAYGPAHYGAYVVRKHALPSGQDLGVASTIDEAIKALREALRDPGRADFERRARAVDELVVRPLRASLGNATRLLISPDGDLNLVPFEALIGADGRFLIEQYATSYLTSGRDLLRLQVPRMPRSESVIVADPLFGEPSTANRDQYFPPLGNTAEEARAIKTLFPEATLLTGRHATKAALQQVEAPRMLHIASHGFFVVGPAVSRQPPTTVSVGGTRAMNANINVENPLLRSGLALAGANLARDAHDDGILTALEASGLNLWGTKLVTLSACDTGIGEVRNGEGVYGLRRAFVLAGTETLVMSLWPVSDFVTRETMAAFYAGLRGGAGRGDALRQAKLAMPRRKGRRHPFYWASFIESGEWASLEGKR